MLSPSKKFLHALDVMMAHTTAIKMARKGKNKTLANMLQ
jgi:hypothetical protein